MTDTDRRALLKAAAATLTLHAAPSSAAGLAPSPALTRPRPARAAPGRPGDFDFLTGHWHIQNQRRLADGRLDEFAGSARVVGLLDGAASVEELSIPARQFFGLGLRLLDREQQQWNDFWVNARSGQLVPPGLPGSFDDSGAGVFESREEDQGVPVIYRSVWDLITPRSCRWQQGTSRDGGQSWQVDWSMRWERQA